MNTGDFHFRKLGLEVYAFFVTTYSHSIADLREKKKRGKFNLHSTSFLYPLLISPPPGIYDSFLVVLGGRKIS